MKMGEALLARAKADSGLTAVFGARIYWKVAPQKAALPYLVLAVVGGDRPQDLEGFVGMATADVQASSFAGSYGTSRDGAEAAIAALVPEGEAGDVVFWRGGASEPIDLGEQSETGFIYHAAVDLTVRWSSAT